MSKAAVLVKHLKTLVAAGPTGRMHHAMTSAFATGQPSIESGRQQQQSDCHVIDAVAYVLL